MQNNTAIDFDSMNNKYILVKFRQDENSTKTFKPEKGHTTRDDDIEIDDQNTNQIRLILTPFS
jgi:hypothetical protein